MMPTPPEVAAVIERAERYALANEPELASCDPLERRRRLASAAFRALRLRGAVR